jgi:hypothetical protein
MSEPLVSVVLPLFGNHRAVGTLPAISRAWLRQDVPCEVVVAVAEGTQLPDLGDAVRTGRLRIVPAERGTASPGPLRNLAVAQSRAPVLYLGDGDIAPLGGDFLDRALALLDDRAVIQPWMYRMVNASDALAAPPFDRPAGDRACHVTAGPDGVLTAVGGERFSTINPDLTVVDSTTDGVSWQTPDGEPWRPVPFHWGGMLVRREAFDAVGRYSARYLGWGGEDDDLIAKLEGRFGVVRAWKAADGPACLHFEHPRAHTVAGGVEDNRAILKQRLAAGVDAMIQEDLV